MATAGATAEVVRNDVPKPDDGFSTLTAEMSLSFDSEHRLRSENLSFDIDVWYPHLQEHTFRSVFVPLKRIEAEAIRAFHNVSWRHTRDSLTNEEISILSNLEAEITAVIAQEFGERGAFMRLCGRSPKDGEPLDREAPIRDYLHHVREILRHQRATGVAVDESIDIDSLTTLAAVKAIEPNIRMAAIARVSWLNIKNGKDALSLLLTSERVYAEMVDWLKFGEPEQLCFREWEPELKLEYEFRAFVYNGVLTAISQYDHYAYYPDLHTQRDKLLRGLYQYWKMVHESIKLQGGSYVIDIGYLHQSDRFIVIELSPYTPCTGAALFHWREDIAILQGAKFQVASPTASTDQLLLDDEDYISKIEFKLKLASDVHPQLTDLIDMNWDDRWRANERPYWEIYELGHNGDNKNSSNSSSSSLISFVSSGVTSFRNIISNAFSSKGKPTASNVCEDLNNLLFVYGTLKQGFHWNTKYLAPRLGALFVSNAVTCDKYPLVIGDCGVPYLLGDEDLVGLGHQIVGQLWRVNDAALKGLDEYEGISKGYYRRIEIPVQTQSSEGDTASAPSQMVTANVYVYQCSNEDLRSRPFLPEYTWEDHRRLYCPMLHIQRKQMAYIGQPSLWGKTNKAVEDGLASPAN
jgi:gamma-glutamylcyclotransferase (GGCT)/AIG2-like uncharacterized protein YtfP